jgi:hypothetical protein
MPTKIRLIMGDMSVDAELFDTQCAKAIADSLPIETRPDEWGDEFYFGIPVKMEPDGTATTKVAVGDIGYWPPGNALAIFFGPTPMSTGPEPVPASEVNLVGKIAGDGRLLKKAKGAMKIRLEKA